MLYPDPFCSLSHSLPPPFSLSLSYSQSGSPTHLALVREAANFKLKHGRKREAISDLEQLWKYVVPALFIVFRRRRWEVY